MRKRHIFIIIFFTVLIYYLTNIASISNTFMNKNMGEKLMNYGRNKDTISARISEDETDGQYKDKSYKLSWKLLEQITYTEKITTQYAEPILYPEVNRTLKNLKGREVELNGFIIPIDNNLYALSKNVMASCFFCGMAGPETISGIKFKGETPRLKTDQYITIRGTFRFNETNPDDWIYHVDDAIIIFGK